MGTTPPFSLSKNLITGTKKASRSLLIKLALKCLLNKRHFKKNYSAAGASSFFSAASFIERWSRPWRLIFNT